MADDQTVDDQQDPQAGDQPEPGWARALRQKAKQVEAENEALKAQLAQGQRESLFAKIGIPDKGPGAQFRKHYDGDLSEEAVLKAATEDWGVLNQERTTPQDERETLTRIRDATSGATAPSDLAVIDSVTKQVNEAKSADEIKQILHTNGLAIYDS
jgi:hypothetical protein